MNSFYYRIYLLAVLFLLPFPVHAAIDAPHNQTCIISCCSCHDPSLPDSPLYATSDINNFCTANCHNALSAPYTDTSAPIAATHITKVCTDCHDPHAQGQKNWKRDYSAEFSLFSGRIDSYADNGNGTYGITYSSGTFRSGWTAGNITDKTISQRRPILLPNVKKLGWTFPVTAVTENGEANGSKTGTMTVKGDLAPVYAYVNPPTNFAVIYGQYVRQNIDADDDGIYEASVRFFDKSGAYSFARDESGDGTDETPDGICQVCHTTTDHWRADGTLAGNHYSGQNCTSACHPHKDGFIHGGGASGGGASCATAIACHGTHVSHTSHTGMAGLECADCHDTNDYPKLKDDQDLANTTACSNCHSADGVASARTYFIAGGWSAAEGEDNFCGSCHDVTPGNSQSDGLGDAAQNIMGDNATYGYFVTGHGKPSGTYTRLSWQDTAASGNPAAAQPCSGCHDLTSQHFNNAAKRLKAGFANDQANSNCNNCHTSAGDDPNPDNYTTSADYENSAHGGKLCTDCHDVHGMVAAATPAMTRAGQESLCYQCHNTSGSPGTVRNANIDPLDTGTHNGGGNQATLSDSTKGWTTNAMVGKTVENITDDSWGVITANTATTITATLAGGTENDWDSSDVYAVPEVSDIASAFGMSEKHNLDTAFEVGGKNYTLQCVSCHNVHVITGRYWQAGQNKTPVTRFPPDDAGNLQPWGDEAGEKMDDYAGGGTYRTPNGDIFNGAQLPDYAGFCLDCHADSNGHANFNIGWGGDPHGQQAANQPNGYGTCPNWYTCGKAEGWDNDDCVADDPADCWPVMTRGLGDQIWSRPAFTHEDRVAGANFTLSCSDCHEAHGSNASSMLRSNPNGGTGTSNWNTMCNNCHYYYSDWHAGMSCGTASCHVDNSIHRMGSKTGSGGTRTINKDMVLHYAFENNLYDSGSWQMDGKWMDDLAGSYTPGKAGQALVLAGNKNVQVGTENGYWSTDEGYHGTWKFTEMKYNTTLEAWVYPTDNAQSQYSIFTKHTGYANGGYEFSLNKIGSGLRAAFRAQIDNNGTVQNGMAGVRGAYSSVAVPLNTWTHVAAVFDTAGPDRDANDPSVGRIRIYVNGEDVTTSASAGDFTQPGVNETSMFAYSENSPWNEAICYGGSWCASEFSIGGFYGWQNEFIGRLDEAKVWNISKNAVYFAPFDSQTAPYISSVEGLIGTTQLSVVFSEGVYTGTGQSGNLIAADFTLTDTGGNNPRTITNVTHTAGQRTATLTMSQPLAVADIGADTLAAAVNAIYDEYNNAAGTATTAIGMASTCPTSPVTFALNNAPGSSYIMDSQNVLYGVVTGGAAALTGSAYSSDGANRYIDFEYNDTCLQATTAMTVEARVKPTGIVADGSNYIRRILERAGSNNYQVSLWRNNGTTLQDPPNNTVMVALWVKPVDAHGGNAWKAVLTDFNSCPIVNDKWYQIKVVWNSSVVGGIPATIYVDDQGANGDNVGESWSGYISCADADQSQMPAVSQIWQGDEITPADGDFLIGANVTNHANNVFYGLIDWITWKDSAE